MFSTVLPIWVVAFLLCVSCGSIGRRLTSSPSPMVAMLGGWCAFLALCAVPWIFGLPANVASPLFWAFFATGLVLAIHGRRRAELTFAAVGTTVITAVLCAPFLRYPGLLAYGAHGLDMWGYIMTADWLQHHPIRQLPEIGVSSMRFNWTWHVLVTRERPLIYESLACLGSATGLGSAKAYVAYPIGLLASLAVACSREPRIFRLKSSWLALLPALVLVFHPLVVLPWIAGYFGGSITALFAALAFAGVALAGDPRSRTEVLALAVLMFVFCGALYTVKFLYVGLALAAVSGLVPVGGALLRHDFSPLLGTRPSGRMMGILAAIVIMTAALLVLGRDQKPDPGDAQLPITAAGHVLGIFGGTSPYVWLGFAPGGVFDRNPLYNPVGGAALVLMVTLFVLVSWARWKAARDTRIPLLLGLCFGMIALSAGDELIMAKTLVIFGFALVIMLAAISAELDHAWLGFMALAVCCLPALRSATEMKGMLHEPYIICTEANVASIRDGQDWTVLSYLHFREDDNGFNWSKFPRTYHSVTHFLPLQFRQRLAAKYHMPKPKD